MYSCMMEEIRIPIHKQMVQLNIYQTYMHGGVMQNKIYYNQIMINMHLEHMLEYLIDERWIIISYNLYFYQAIIPVCCYRQSWYKYRICIVARILICRNLHDQMVDGVSWSDSNTRWTKALLSITRDGSNKKLRWKPYSLQKQVQLQANLTALLRTKLV